MDDKNEEKVYNYFQSSGKRIDKFFLYFINNKRDLIFVCFKYDEINCLKYLHKNGYSLRNFAVMAAVTNGHLECLIYLNENNCFTNEYVIAVAALKGNLDCLSYLHENGCPWDETTCEGASQEGHLDCLIYVCENNFPIDIKECSKIAKNDEIKKYLLSLKK